MPPVAIGAGIGAALGIGGAGLAAATGAGKSKYAARNFKETGHYDPNRYEYGGRAGAADEAANHWRGQSDQYNKAASGMLGDAAQAQAQQNAARAGQSQAAGMMMNRAQGNDLISARVADQARQQILGEAASGQASARGAAGIALAQQNAANAASSGLASNAANEMIAGSQEKLAAEQAAMGAYSNMREGDISNRGQSISGAGQMGQLGASYGQLEGNVRQQQMVGNLAEQQNAAQSHQQVQSIDSGTQQNNANRDMDYIKMAMGATSGGAQAGAAVPPPQGKAAGGPVTGGTPYLMGELGPELVVPTLGGSRANGSGGVDIGSKGFASAEDIQNASTGTYGNYSGKELGMVGGGGLTGGDVGGLGMVGGGGQVGGGLLGGFRADGGPVDAGRPYVVGERGPELVVPRKDAVVIPAHQTAEILPLMDAPDGRLLQVSDDGGAFYAPPSSPADDGRPSLSGPAPRYSKAETAVAEPRARAAKSAAPARKRTPEDLMREADELMASLRRDHEARMAEGPAVRRKGG